MSRIYIVTDCTTGALVRYVRANTLNGAVRAVANEHFIAAPADHDTLFAAFKSKAEILDAVEPEQEDLPLTGTGNGALGAVKGPD
jgi:ActR/RegA family two-component response regulator